MKVSRIEIKDFQQFKDFKLDLTYPNGHAKAGEPLDKVCFIGQSGTGKTILLEFLREGSLYNHHIENGKHSTLSKGYIRIYSETADFKYMKTLLPGNQSRYGIKKGYENNDEDFTNWTINGERCVIYFPFGTNAFTKNLDKDLDKAIEIVIKYQNEYYYEFNYETIIATWQDIYHQITDYKNKEADFRLKSTERLESENFDFKKSLENWRSENPNPLEAIAEGCLDKILNQIHLKVKTRVDSVKELNSIQIEKLDGTKTIDYEQLSTGTRQFIFTALPLHLLDSKDAIILIDEPETSLYPDIQRQIVPTYTDLAPDAQFFFATHSPVILSSFEPWEIVVLEFDEDGFVEPKKMYKGERHVDNYIANPRFLRWDDILMTYLGLSEEGSEERKKMRHELTLLGNELKSLNGGNDELKQQLWKKYDEKATKLGWDTIREQ
jgi:predicted ATP-dependent endonuclease of OLD family